MASFKALFCLLLHVFFLISSSGTRLFDSFSFSDQAMQEEAKAWNSQQPLNRVVKQELWHDVSLEFESKQPHPLPSIIKNKARNKPSADKLELIDRHFESKQFSGISQLALAVEAKEHPKTGRQEVSETIHESKQFPSSTKNTLIEEAREAIKASIERNFGNPFESKRLSPGGPDPYHH